MRTGTLVTSRRLCLHRDVAAALFVSATLLVGCSSSGATTSQSVVAAAATSGSGQADSVGLTLRAPIVVTLTNAAGFPVAGAPVTFTSTGGMTVGDSTAVTDASGQVTESVTLGHVPGIDTVTATDVTAGESALFIETAITGSAVVLVVDSGNGQSGTHGTRLPTPLSVLVQDRYGNPVARSAVNWAASLGILGALTSVSDNNGQAQVVFTLAGIAGTDSVTATLPHGTGSVVFTETGN